MKCYCVNLVRMKVGVLFAEPADEEYKLFSSMKAAEKWLVDNNFVYGQRSFFNYPDGDEVWFHKDDMRMEFIEVFIMKLKVDDLSKSKFKNLCKIHRKCLPGDVFRAWEKIEKGKSR